MADPLVAAETATDIAKVGGGGGITALIMFLANRYFGKQDKAESETVTLLTVIQGTLNGLVKDVAVVINDNTHTKTDVAQMQVQIGQLTAQLNELRGEFNSFKESVAR